MSFDSSNVQEALNQLNEYVKEHKNDYEITLKEWKLETINGEEMPVLKVKNKINLNPQPQYVINARNKEEIIKYAHKKGAIVIVDALNKTYKMFEKYINKE